MSKSLCDEYFERRHPELLPYESEDKGGVILYGLPGVGRTRLLEQLKRRGDPDPKVRAGQDPLPSHYCVLSLSNDNNDLPIPWEELLYRILRQTRRDYPNRDEVTKLELLYRPAQWKNGMVSRSSEREPTDPPATDALDSNISSEGSREELTWLGFFEHLHQIVPEFRILFLVDDLDKTTYAIQPADYTMVSGYHILRFAIQSPSAWVVATSSKELDEGIKIDRFFTAFRQDALRPFSEAEINQMMRRISDDEEFAKDVYKWTGGIPELVCTLLNYYDLEKFEVSDRELSLWLSKDVGPWYEKFKDQLRVSARIALEKMASHEVYQIDAEKNKALMVHINDLVDLGLVKRINDHPQRPTYRIAAKGLKKEIELENPANKKGKLLNLFPFTPQKLYWISFSILLASVIIMIVLRGLSIEPLWGALILLFPLIYGLIGVFQRKTHESLSHG